jgi:hypothetical protein
MPRRRAFLLFVCLPLATLVFSSGPGCPGVNVVVDTPPVVIREDPGTVIVIEPDAFGIDLVNDTLFDADPGVWVDDFLLDLGTLAPLEGTDFPVAFDVDCFAGDTLTIDPTLLLPANVDLVAANGPVVLEEGIDYLCGDIITIELSQDGSGTFFVDVFVNDVLINP